MQVIISGAALQSAFMCAPKDDIRYYLNNVYVEWNDRTTRVVSTDGHIMYLSDEVPTVAANDGSGSLLIPQSVLAQLKPKANGTLPHYMLTAEPLNVEGTCTIYTCSLRGIADAVEVKFTSGEGVFPDYTRVVPRFTAIDLIKTDGDRHSDTYTYQCMDIIGKPTIVVDACLHDRFIETMGNNSRQTCADFNFDYLTLAQKVQKVHNGSKAKSPQLFQNGLGAALVRFTDNAYMVIMPMRQDDRKPPLLDNFRSRIEVKEEEKPNLSVVGAN